MGDRSNIIIESDDKSRIYLYSHWDGERLIESAIHGASSGRTNDAPYLARVIAQHMYRNESLDDETGYGISAYPTDNEHPYIVFTEDGNVHFESEGGTVLTKPVRGIQFVEHVTSIEGWQERAEQNELYDMVIARIGR